MSSAPASRQFRERLAAEAVRRGLAVWSGDRREFRPIPLATEPLRVSRADWDDLVADSRVVLSAFPLVLRWLQGPAQSGLRGVVFRGLKGIEAAAALADPQNSLDHATIRFDLFWHDGLWRIIEANCTIPAMQAYSDMARSAWLAAAGKPALEVTEAGNSTQLLNSLTALARRDGAHEKRLSIVILHRPDDAQISELKHFQSAWGGSHDVHLCTPERLALRSPAGFSMDRKIDGKLDIDVVYRHIFAWRLESLRDIATALARHRQYRIYNPVSAHYEAKAFLALLSTLAADDHLAAVVGLSPEQREAVRRRVPWTRVIGDGDHLVSAESIQDAELDQLVFKSSYGYGGAQVFVGSEWQKPAVQDRLRQITGISGVISVRDFLGFISSQVEQTWIVQRRMAGMRHKTQVTQVSAATEAIDGFADLSVFLDCNQPPQCSGGVSRFAAGPVVNIGTGGGLAPLEIV